jgi:hypothetical protein
LWSGGTYCGTRTKGKNVPTRRSEKGRGLSTARVNPSPQAPNSWPFNAGVKQLARTDGTGGTLYVYVRWTATPLVYREDSKPRAGGLLPSPKQRPSHTRHSAWPKTALPGGSSGASPARRKRARGKNAVTHWSEKGMRFYPVE